MGWYGYFEGMGACRVGEWSLGLILGDYSGDNGGSGVVVAKKRKRGRNGFKMRYREY